MSLSRMKSVLNRTVDILLSLLYPERCVFCDEVIWGDGEELVCAACKDAPIYIKDLYCLKCGKRIEEKGKEVCDNCHDKKHYFDRGRVLFDYNDAVRESIYRLKYNNRRRYAIYYGDKLAECFGEWLKEKKVQAIVPIPLHKSRFAARGYNQAQLLAKRVSEKTGIALRDDLLIRVKKTEAQKLMNADERHNNLKNAFKIGVFDVKLETVVLIDDIYTTGSTMDEAARVIRQAGVQNVYCLSLASGGR